MASLFSSKAALPRLVSYSTRVSVPISRCRCTGRAYSTAEPPLLTTSIPAPHNGRILVLSLNRPSVRNALSVALVSSLNSTLAEIHSEGASGPTRAVIVASNVDSAFCAGADLKERQSMNTDQVQEFLANLRGSLKALEALPIPTIAAVSGTALGGGLEVALSTTMRIFASTATVGLPETRLAIVPGAGGTYRLPNLVGMSRARELILTGRRISAPEAYFLGLCNRLVEVLPEEGESMEDLSRRARETVLQEAVGMANEICEGAPTAVRSALKAIGRGEDAENAAYNEILTTEDRIEALKAFAEKRKPVYRGK
ncbi:methylglutaconyl-CoA hydratase [Eremomyces bilateralis CBS 781.70]|uniref:Methylglutaconyl-CoA hydratase n=1 Tax=Eremomyces bilateralis CBS 781.70 TaxID=1392243 RepID=A0A6G1FRZ3_9PEZI|nr:methylglutaconyl-CoA hydratase [Eremomyces bilateralis CBS 781.70]KAF1808461.1 methylglutaconyl-CoA hydratase [Eremomyces bilateralis CBS 781.70]